VTWLGAVEQGSSAFFNPDGLEKGSSSREVGYRNMPEGTFLFEATVPELSRQPVDLITFDITENTRRSIHVVFGPSGRLWCATEYGTHVSVVSVDLSTWERQTDIRIGYSWSVPRALGILSAENIVTGEIAIATTDDCVPLNQVDLARFIFDDLSDDVASFAFSDRIEPVGYVDGVGGDTVIRTQDGELPIQELTAGTKLWTDSGKLARVLAVVERQVPNVGLMRMHRLRRPFEQLTRSTTLSQGCQIMTSGTDADYLFGEQYVFVRAGEVTPFLSSTYKSQQLVTARWSLVVEGGEAVEANGIFLSSATCHHSIDAHKFTALRDVEHASLPRQTASKSLESFEAIALLSGRYR